MNFFMKFVMGLLSGKIIRHAKKRGAEYSFLFVHPDGSQLAAIGELLKAEKIRPVIDRVFRFDQVKGRCPPRARPGQGEGGCADEVNGGGGLNGVHEAHHLICIEWRAWNLIKLVCVSLL